MGFYCCVVNSNGFGNGFEVGFFLMKPPSPKRVYWSICNKSGKIEEYKNFSNTWVKKLQGGFVFLILDSNHWTILVRSVKFLQGFDQLPYRWMR